MRKLLLYPLILVAGLLVGLYLSDGSVWTLVAGPPDMGRETFGEADRPINQFIACTRGADCVAPNLVLEPHPAGPARLLAILDEWTASEPRVERVDDGSDPLHRRYVARSAFFKFPDTISIDAVPSEGGTAFRFSSRSQIGVDDMGVNRARVRNWLARTGVAVPVVSPEG